MDLADKAIMVVLVVELHLHIQAVVVEVQVSKAEILQEQLVVV